MKKKTLYVQPETTIVMLSAKPLLQDLSYDGGSNPDSDDWGAKGFTWSDDDDNPDGDDNSLWD